MRRIVLGAVAGGLAVIAVGTLAAYYVEKPSMVRIAVARDTEDFRLITAAQQVLRGDHQNVRFRVVPVDTAAQSAAALEGGSVDFAVVRSDIDMPKSGQTALIFHRNSAVILAPAKSAIHSSTDLNA